MSENDDLQIIQSDAGLIADVRSMIAQTREGVARVVNQGMTLLYWRIGKRIKAKVPGNQRAEYGNEIVATLSRQLVEEFGTGFSVKGLSNDLPRQLRPDFFRTLLHELMTARTRVKEIDKDNHDPPIQ